MALLQRLQGEQVERGRIKAEERVKLTGTLQAAPAVLSDTNIDNDSRKCATHEKIRRRVVDVGTGAQKRI